MIKVLLVDDHELVRTGVRLLLKDAENIEVMAEAKNGEEAVRIARESLPDVVLMDLNMPGMGGFEATMRLLRGKPVPKILILSAHANGLVPVRLLNLGALGFLSKHSNREEMIRAIQTVNAGERYIDSSMAETIASVQFILQNSPPPIAQLVERELQILIMLANKMKRNEIAKSLFLSKKTISGYLINALKKLGASTESEAVRMIIESGLVDID